MDIKLDFIPLEVMGYMSLKIPNDLFCDLNNQMLFLLNNNFFNAQKNNSTLYGAIEHEYALPNTYLLDKFLKFIVPSFWKFHYDFNRANKQYELSPCWINYQKKFEHNPFHNHNGDLSFVIWMSIPYDIDEERKVNNVKDSNNFTNETTAFSFIFPSFESKKFFGLEKHIIQVSKQDEGRMILFNSKLPHLVYPFYTSNNFRISISGNLKELS